MLRAGEVAFLHSQWLRWSGWLRSSVCGAVLEASECPSGSTCTLRKPAGSQWCHAMSCPLPRAHGSSAILLAGETAAQKLAIVFACRLHGAKDTLLVRVTTFFSARASSGVLGSSTQSVCVTGRRALPASTLPCATGSVSLRTTTFGVRIVSTRIRVHPNFIANPVFGSFFLRMSVLNWNWKDEKVQSDERCTAQAWRPAPSAA